MGQAPNGASIAERWRDAPKNVEAAFEEAVRGAVLATGAEHAVLLASSNGDECDVVVATPGVELPSTVVVPPGITSVGAQIWSSGSDRPPPLPFAARLGWGHLVAAPVRLEGHGPALLVAGGRGDARDQELALQRLELVAALLTTAVDNAVLGDQFRRLEELLTAAVSVSAALVEATDPAAARHTLLSGIVQDMGLSGAVLWCEDEEGGDGLKLLAEVGLPAEVRARVERLDAATVAARLFQACTSERGSATAVAASSWPDQRLLLVTIPDPASGVLGVYTTRPLPELVGGVLATLAHALAAAVQQTTLHRRIQSVMDSLQRELQPRNVALPEVVEGGKVYQPATAGVPVSGDFFDWFVTEKGHVGVACGDVSGKGVEAASLMAMTVYSLRAFALRGTSAPIVLTQLNSTVCQQTITERFVTTAYARIDPADWSVQLALAGHPPPILLRPDGAELIAAVPGLPLGIDPGARYEATELHLGEGCGLVLYTDGVTEARHHDPSGKGELFGTECLVATLEGLAGRGAQEIADGIWEAIQAWTGGGTADDCAVVVLRRRAQA